MIHFSLSNFNVLYVYLAPRAEPEGLKRARGATDAIPRFRDMRGNRENHNTMKNTAQEGARGRAGRDSPPPQQPLDILNTCAITRLFVARGKFREQRVTRWTGAVIPFFVKSPRHEETGNAGERRNKMRERAG